MSDTIFDESDMDAYYSVQAPLFRKWGLSFEIRLESTEDQVAYLRDIKRLEASLARNLSAAGPIVELGCGPSRLRNVNKNRVLIMVDRSIGMLREARGFHGDHQRHYIQADSRQLPIADGSASLVVCTFVLSHMDEAGCQATVREIQRVLAPEGRAVVADSTRSIVTTRNALIQRRTAANGLTYSILKYYRSVEQVRELFFGGTFTESGDSRFIFTLEWRNA